MKRLLLLSLLVIACATKPAPAPRYLFFLHGKIVEDQGRKGVSPQYGPYDYDGMLEAFTKRGFVVRSEARPQNTDVAQYAEKVAGQIRELLAAGVPPERITVLGASKGSVIAMLVSTELQNENVRFVLMGNCNDATFELRKPRLAGRILSIYDETDVIGHSCARFRAAGTKISGYKEIALNLGKGHGFLYQAYPAWVEPAAAWAGE